MHTLSCHWEPAKRYTYSYVYARMVWLALFLREPLAILGSSSATSVVDRRVALLRGRGNAYAAGRPARAR
jgi:hypothetical protein